MAWKIEKEGENEKIGGTRGSRAGPFVDGEQICLQALSNPPLTHKMFWDLLNFNRECD